MSFSARKFLDRKIYDRGLESTTGELIRYLEAEKDSGHLNLSEKPLRISGSFWNEPTWRNLPIISRM